ncbi:MAG: hypothetical protein CMJ31_06405 [Phycisphaerae bacterium]|nr:hypothetical protein [Phycisphaerae bacterium]
MWIDGQAYWVWLGGRKTVRATLEAAPGSEAQVGEDDAVLSPRSRRIMRKYRVGQSLGFVIDHDSVSGGFWLDGEEFEALNERRLLDALHVICSDRYQAGLRDAAALRARENDAERVLGAELAHAVRDLALRAAGARRGPEALAYLRARLEAAADGSTSGF